jgi:hypothetical protein
MVLFSLLHSQWRECCPGESPLLHIAFVRIAVHPLLMSPNASNLRFPSLSPRIFQIYIVIAC